MKEDSMMYNKKCVCVVKVNGRILREFNNSNSESSVLIPFNSHYAIMVKNLESRDARMRVSIDGEDVLSGNWIIVKAGKTEELSGFMNACGKVTNRFKFIQKTEKIIDHRGDRIDDGILKLEYQFEKEQPVRIDTHEYHHHHHDYWDHHHYYPKPYWPWYPSTPGITYTSNTTETRSTKGILSNTTGSADFHSGGVISACCDSLACERSCKVVMPVSPLPDEGITVRGREINEEYKTGYLGELEPDVYVMIIRLKGTSKVCGSEIVAPVEVKTKVECPTCGTKSKSGIKYCPECGTCLVIV
jgi:hypothetical protein